jgi:pyruvyl transferase EpsO
MNGSSRAHMAGRTGTPQAALLAEMQEGIECALSPVVRPNENFALLDFPDHPNVGDSAIYLGALSYFEARGMSPDYVSTLWDCNWEVAGRIADRGTIYLNGGGNFGDLWPLHHEFREAVLQRFKGQRVIQLPQTIYFSSQKKLDRTARLISDHGSFTLLVRDHQSFEIASRSFDCTVGLCPDMAFHLKLVPNPRPRVDLLLHLRRDKEAATTYDIRAVMEQYDSVCLDWGSESFQFLLQRKAASRLMHIIKSAGDKRTSGWRHGYYRPLAEERLRRGRKLLEIGRTLVTDRMHGHIISLLLGLPHCVLDNSYGKTSSFISTWGTCVGNAHAARNLGEAVEMLGLREELKGRRRKVVPSVL